MAQQLVVHAGQRLEHERFAGGMHAQDVAVGGDGGGLVDRHPAGHAVPEGSRGDGGELPQPVGRVPVHPAAGLIQRQRGVPVVERGHGGNAVGEQQVDQPVIEVQAGRVHRAAAAGLDPGPGQREPVRIDPQFLHQRHVLGHPVVVVAGDGRAVVLHDRARLRGEDIPPGRAAAVFIERTLDLEGRRRHAQGEAGRKQGSQIMWRKRSSTGPLCSFGGGLTDFRLSPGPRATTSGLTDATPLTTVDPCT